MVREIGQPLVIWSLSLARDLMFMAYTKLTHDIRCQIQAIIKTDLRQKDITDMDGVSQPTISWEL